MHRRIKQCCILVVFALFNLAYLNTALAESTTVTSSGIRFPDGTTQTTAATGGSSLWSQSASDIYYNGGNVGIGTTDPASILEVALGSSGVAQDKAIKIQGTHDPGIILDNTDYTRYDILSGGGGDSDFNNKFSIFDRTNYAARLVIDNAGNVGIGMRNPTQKLSVSGTIESTSGGIKFPDGTTQTTAASGGGTSPWNISGSNVYYNSGNVGIGTTSPASILEVALGSSGVAQNKAIKIQGTHDPGIILDNTDYTRYDILSGGGGDSDFNNKFSIFDRTNYATRLVIDNTGNVGLGMRNPVYPLEMASGAHVTMAGVWTDASSRDYKENIRDLTYDEAKLALSELTPSKFNYKIDKDDEYLGFIAEDVPDLVATKDRKGLSPMDIVAVLTKVVQQQQAIVEQQQEEINGLKKLLSNIQSQ